MELVSRYFFRLDFMDEDSPYTRDVYCPMDFFGHPIKKYSEDGNTIGPYYNSVDIKHRIPGLEQANSVIPLCAGILQKIRSFDIVQSLKEKTLIAFPESAPFSYSHTNVFLHIDHSIAKSDHRPFYGVFFRFEFLYSSDTYINEKKPWKKFYDENTVAGYFHDRFHPANNLLEYLTGLSRMESIKEGVDFIVTSTKHTEIHNGSSITPVYTEYKPPAHCAKL